MLTLAIPNFNGEGFLPQTLESLSAQRPHLTWWLQDSCSSDRSAEIAKSFQKDGDVITIEKDGGQADGLNRAFRQMGGDIVGYINSDDRLVDGAAQFVCEQFSRDPDLDVLYGEVEWIDSAGSVTGHHAGNISDLAEVLDIYRVWWNRRQWVQPEVFFRRRVWDRVGEFNTNYHLAFDFEYWVRCFQAGVKVRRVPRVLAQFRLHPNQKSSQPGRAADEIREIVESALSSVSSLDPRHQRRIKTMLAYDRFQSGAQEWNGQSSLGLMLLRNPAWLLLPEVRTRVTSACGRRLGITR